MEPQQPTNPFAIPAAIVIAGIFIAGAIFFGGVKSTPAPKTAVTPPAQPQAQTADISKVNTNGEPFIGRPNAPVVMAYWYDYQCPFCQRHEELTMPQIIKDYVDTGKVKIVFKDYQFLGDDSQTLGKFSRAVWETAPNKFYAWHKAIYDNQGQENTGWATQSKIMLTTTNILGADGAGKVASLVEKNGDAYQKEMDADKIEGITMGVKGTPGTIIGKELIAGAVPYEQFKAVLDKALAGN